MSYKRKHGFSLVEIVVVVLIISVLTTAAFFGGAAVIKKSRTNKTKSDLRTFSLSVEQAVYAVPDIVSVASTTNKSRLEGVMKTINHYLPSGYEVSLVSGTMSGNIVKASSTGDNTNYIVCESVQTDPWKNPYYVVIDRSERTSTDVAELFITVLSAGPNGALHVDGQIDEDDVFSLIMCQNETFSYRVFNMSDKTDSNTLKTHSGTKASSFVNPSSAPVLNG